MTLEKLPEDFAVEGKKVFFVRQNGKPTENAVCAGGEDENGNLCFFEIVSPQVLRDSVGGKPKYARILIQRVFPALPIEESEVQS